MKLSFDGKNNPNRKAAKEWLRIHRSDYSSATSVTLSTCLLLFAAAMHLM